MNAIDLNKPLIWTAHGNRNVDELDLQVVWDVNDAFIKLREIYYDKATGELVKESAHVYDLRGTFGAGAVGGIG